ncbi:SdrD B-like domain-containing protein [Epilithonimonas xixisoli]|uniref:SdrD B-like protein n=1 Tax=Epilithonimonas xixisoli TaxID=1476462 RepID=A0A4R8IBI1_9FLAO|nr:SdrD B-like domain-containing protein [Epilithonimonas xixisoli]TDX86940.1 SdrD B-like protein [Epilithonimonas xixisoli]
MKKLLTLWFLIIGILGFSQFPISKIYTDFNGYWISGTAASPNPVKPNNSHLLLGFTWKGNTYSTGVNDASLVSQGISFQTQEYTSFPVASSVGNAGSNTFIGVGSNYGGAGNVMPIPVENNLLKYLTDGTSGLDLGTGIFNFPQSSKISYDITSINPTSIGDGIPDLIITQIGDISNVLDNYYFVDATNNIVGSQYAVDFGSVPDLGNADWKFYNANVSSPTYNASVSSSPTRKLRLLAFDWSELGLNISNISQVKRLVQVFSGQSDMAFTAYNKSSIILKMSVSGTVYNDNNAGVPNGIGYSGASVVLKDSSGTTVASTSTDSNGIYVFPNVSAGIYTVQLSIPTGFVVVGNSDGNTANTLSVSVAGTPVINKNFGINQPPIATNDNVVTTFNTSVSVNISTNDIDPNSGSVVPRTINLVAPSNAGNVIYDNGNIKGFTVVGEGTWFVDNSGTFTFTPATGFSGIATTVKYTIKDVAGLTSNLANISIRVEDFCYKPSATIGIRLNTNHGISSLGRAGSDNADSWPMVRKGAWTALESKTKGFVVNRILTTSNVNAIPNPIDGMLVYDEEADCLKIYTTNDNGGTFSWKCFTKQTCPN